MDACWLQKRKSGVHVENGSTAFVSYLKPWLEQTYTLWSLPFCPKRAQSGKVHECAFVMDRIGCRVLNCGNSAACIYTQTSKNSTTTYTPP